MKKSNKFLLLFTGLGVVCILLFFVCIVVSKKQGSSYEILGINALLLEAVLFIIGMLFLTIANILSVKYWKEKGTAVGRRQVYKNVRKAFRGEKNNI